MEGDAIADEAITPAPHGTSEHVQHSSTTSHPTHGISGITPFPNPTLVGKRNPTNVIS